jgi:hypothetical protein
MVTASSRGGADVMAQDGRPLIPNAQTSFDDACSDLDAAVTSLGRGGGDTVMANEDLVALLVRVVSARRHLEDGRAHNDIVASDSAS